MSCTFSETNNITAAQGKESLRAVSETLRQMRLDGRGESSLPERFRYSDLKEAVWNLTAMDFEWS
jgi:hypothetical protein